MMTFILPLGEVEGFLLGKDGLLCLAGDVEGFLEGGLPPVLDGLRNEGSF